MLFGAEQSPSVSVSVFGNMDEVTTKMDTLFLLQPIRILGTIEHLIHNPPPASYFGWNATRRRIMQPALLPMPIPP